MLEFRREIGTATAPERPLPGLGDGTLWLVCPSVFPQVRYDLISQAAPWVRIRGESGPAPGPMAEGVSPADWKPGRSAEARAPDDGRGWVPQPTSVHQEHLMAREPLIITGVAVAAVAVGSWASAGSGPGLGRVWAGSGPG